jgi:hypothetical protein
VFSQRLSVAFLLSLRKRARVSFARLHQSFSN